MLNVIVMNMLRGMVGALPSYSVRRYALSYYEKEFINMDELCEIEEMLTGDADGEY